MRGAIFFRGNDFQEPGKAEKRTTRKNVGWMFVSSFAHACGPFRSGHFFLLAGRLAEQAGKTSRKTKEYKDRSIVEITSAS